MNSKLLLVILAVIGTACGNQEATKCIAQDHKGNCLDSISLNHQCLQVFRFGDKGVRGLNRLISIENDENLVFNLGGVWDYATGMMGYVFVLESDTMYIELATGFSSYLVDVKEFKKGLYEFTATNFKEKRDTIVGNEFIKNDLINSIPIAYQDFRSQSKEFARTIGRTTFTIWELAPIHLKEVHHFRREGIMEYIDQLND